MTKILRYPVGLGFFGAGVSLVWWSGTRILLSLSNDGGVTFYSLAVLVLGVVAVGAAAECFHLMPATGEKQKEPIAHSAWASRPEITRAGLFEKAPRGDARKSPIYLGTFTDKDGTDELLCHGGKSVISFGVPGANKSTGLVIPALSEQQRSIAPVDLKGELFQITGSKRAEMGKVLRCDPHGVCDGALPEIPRFHWSPILQLDPESDDFANMAYVTADAIIDKGDGGGNSKFFEASALNLAAAFTMWERYSQGANASLYHLRAMIAEPTVYDDEKKPVKGFLFTVQQMAACKHPAIRNVAGRIYARLTDTKSQTTDVQGVIETFMASTRFLDDPRIGADMWKGEAINFAKWHEEIVTCFLIMPPHELAGGGAKWVRLFVNLALASLYRSPPSVAKLPPVLFLLDEFGNLGALSEVLTAMNIARSYRIQLWVFLQNIGQLRANYKNTLGAFFSGSCAVTSFRCGDWDTAETLSKIFGNKEQFVPTIADARISDTAHAIPLIRPEDLMRLGQGEMISTIEPCKMPIKSVAPVYVHTRFNEGLDRNPYYHG